MSIKSKLDQFYTSPKIVEQFLDIIKIFDFINSKTVFIEPSAGDGKFIESIQKRYQNKIIAFDIEKNHSLVKEQNFLTSDIKYSTNNITIGNPPFGKRAKLAIEFINHSSKNSDIICFVLPIQFRRWNVQKQINPELKLIYSSEDLPKNSFSLNNKPVDVNCCFQIWINKNIDKNNKYPDLRIKQAPANKHKDFKIFLYNNTLQAKKYFDKDKYQWDPEFPSCKLKNSVNTSF
ncbi:SAM-dependent methyltransferase [Mycoplasmopsis phocirhinis]|uniref:SAM-dependent methyltransferase n=1 Tax=Mycoplasmopsis phocirhinis TaxID=142650 RepID=A0A4P6MM11_9BACT|nr:SAM-dependent methyltransferase [Mycoplasmopsis phocirhinis]QBF34665.1 SAM-dependent methyltransferase [Mycoplasmopsis phocirhinis]